MNLEANSGGSQEGGGAPFLRLDPSGQRADLWAWIRPCQGEPRLLWSTCPRGDWLVWWLCARRVDPALVIRSCCECLRMAEAGAPLALDLPRSFLVAAAAWADGRGDLALALDAARRCAPLASDDALPQHLRALAHSVVWLGRSMPPELPDTSLELPDTSPPAEPPSEAYLALWHAAAAIASEVNPDEPVGSPWWARCLEAALGRFAEVVRGCIDYDLIAPALG